MGLSIGIDIGGTFTDVIGMDTETRRIMSAKVSSSPQDFAEGFWKAVEKIVALFGASRSEITRMVHGTTVATNAIIQRKGAKIGILTTDGFRGTLIIGRSARPEMNNNFFDIPTPTFICPLNRIIGIKERISAKGDVVTRLDDTEVIRAVKYLVEREGVQAIAVCYLFSYINPTHEQRTRQLIQEQYPNVRISLSSVVNPRFREYERTVITAFDAYVGSTMEMYLRGLEGGLHKHQIETALQVVQSRGGVTSAEICIQKPVVTLLSGPAAGVAGGVFFGNLCGRENIITLDMGGTSNDVALIRDGKPFLTIESQLGNYPLRQAMISVDTIGAGGGSIAYMDPVGGLKVGPQSAGADPGPACYGRGGKDPTVTDASVILGYLNPDYFANGELKLYPELAREAIEKFVAAHLNTGVAEAAAAIHKIINNKMADQLRVVSVYKGYDPREFSLVAFGGAGPVMCGRLIKLLGMKEAIVPIIPGVLSAFGLLVANIEHEEVATLIVRAEEIDPEYITRVFRELENMCEGKRGEVGISSTELRIQRSAEIRYVGQSYELEVQFPERGVKITRDTINEVVKRFHDTHQRVYQHSLPERPVELVALRVVYWQEPEPRTRLNPIRDGLDRKAIPEGHKPAYFDEYSTFVKTPVYLRSNLTYGQILEGPAIVEQLDSTTVVYPGQKAAIDKWGNLIITRA
jgi:N-methylhydantoinase A